MIWHWGNGFEARLSLQYTSAPTATMTASRSGLLRYSSTAMVPARYHVEICRGKE